MTAEEDRKRIRELRNELLLYIHEHDVGRHRGFVSIVDLKNDVKITDLEWQPLYVTLINERVTEIDGQGSNIRLTEHGRTEAEKLLTARNLK